MLPDLPPEPAPENPKIKVEPLTRFTFETALALRVREDQVAYQPDVLFSIAQSKFEDCTPMGIFLGNKMVGFMMVCRFGNVPWISRILVDADEQGNGYGSDALRVVIDQLKQTARVKEIRTSIARGNALAEYLFFKHGFRRMTGMDADKEFVMRLVL